MARRPLAFTFGALSAACISWSMVFRHGPGRAVGFCKGVASLGDCNAANASAKTSRLNALRCIMIPSLLDKPGPLCTLVGLPDRPAIGERQARLIPCNAAKTHHHGRSMRREADRWLCAGWRQVSCRRDEPRIS
jgi:hypothetical protein